MINLLFDATVLINGNIKGRSRTGIYFVGYNVLRILLQRKDIKVGIYTASGNKAALEEAFNEAFPDKKDWDYYSECSDFSSFNVFLSPIFKIPEEIKKQLHITKYTILYDLIILMYPEFFGDTQEWVLELQKSLNFNDYYFSISDNTRHDFIKYTPEIDASKIMTIPLGANELFVPDTSAKHITEIKQKYDIPADKKYLFSLCTLEPRKNLIMAVKSFIRFIEKNKIEDLIYVLGGTCWDGFIEQLENEVPEFEQYSSRIIKAGYIDDEDLSSLYSGAEWFVYTSRYEGFGLPPLEAMKCGCPVIGGNNSSLPEVIGDAGIMIDSDDMEQHIAAYEKYYFDSELRKENVKKGLERAQLFDWDKCVDTILGKIREVEKQKELQPKITVVTSTYNLLQNGRKETFIQTVESVHSQTYPNIEHIIIDGASTDGTIELLQKYVDKGWIKYYSEPDTGVYDAMNKGIKYASGDYIAFLNSDDYYNREDGLAISMAKLQESNADYCYSNAEVVFEDGRKAYWQANIDLIAAASNYCHQTMIMKTSVLREFNGFDLSYKVSADSDLMIRLYAAKKAAVKIDCCFVTYRVGGLSSTSAEQSRRDHSRALYEHIGGDLGLSKKDCYDLWQMKFMDLRNLELQIDLISRLKIPGWVSAFTVQLLNRLQQASLPQPISDTKKSSKLYFFGLPLVKIKSKKSRTLISIFGLPVIKIKRK